eukprot:scaffold18771_cov59-Phaeocystis_antarctica.AAC.1
MPRRAAAQERNLALSTAGRSVHGSSLTCSKGQVTASGSCAALDVLRRRRVEAFTLRLRRTLGLRLPDIYKGSS